MTLRDFRSSIQYAALGQVPSKAALLSTVQTKTVLPTIMATAAATPQITPGMCNPADNSFIWAVTADGTGYWRRRAVGEVCAGTAPIVQSTAPIKEGTCSPDGTKIYKYSGGQWITKDGQPIWQVGTGAWVARAPNDVCYVESIVRTGGGGVSMTVSNTWRTLQARYDQYKAKAVARMADAYAAASALPPCDPSSQFKQKLKKWNHQTNQQEDGGEQVVCYDGDYYGYAPIDRMVNMEPYWNNGEMPPPGGFVRLGVFFNITDVLPGGDKFDKWYAPDADQRFLADYAIALRSRKKILDDDDGRRIIGSGPSVNQYQKDHPDFRYQLDNYSLNPVPPTAAELNNANGFANWIARGGYPLSDALAHGKQPLWGEQVLYVSASEYCRCGPENTPMSIHGHIAIDGIRQGRAESDWATWQQYIDISTPGKIHMWFTHREATWSEKLARSIDDAVHTVFRAACSSKGQEYLQKKATAPSATGSTAAIAAWCIGVNKILADEDAAKAAGQKTFVPPTTPTTPTPTLPPGPIVAPEESGTMSVPALKYAACVARFSKKRERWAIYCPPGVGLGNSGSWLGSSEPPPPGLEFRVELPVKPSEAAQGGLEDKPAYKEWWFWAAIAGGVAAVGTSSYLIVRRRRRRVATPTPA